MYRVEVIADSSGQWAGNGMRFDTIDDAKGYGRDLMSRWVLVRKWHVVDANNAIVGEGGER